MYAKNSGECVSSANTAYNNITKIHITCNNANNASLVTERKLWRCSVSEHNDILLW